MSPTTAQGRTKRPLVLTVALALALAGLAVPAPAFAHESDAIVDQQVDAAPECTTEDFPSATVLDVAEAQRQTFTPALGTLTAVDLCLTVLVGEVLPGTPAFTMNILGDDGAPLASESFSFEGTPLVGSETRFWHIDLAEEVSVVPGGTYAIEVESPRIAFQWRTTCGSDLQACADTDTDRYAGGEASLGGKADFGFRTWAPTGADLDIAVAAPALVCPDVSTLRDTTVTVRNVGTVAVSEFDVELSLGAAEDRQLLGSLTVPGLDVGDDLVLSGSAFDLVAPLDGPSARIDLVGVVDAGDAVLEVNESNNTAAATTTRVPCDTGKLGNLRLSAADGSALPEVEAGIVELSMLDLDPEDLAAGAAGFTSPTGTRQDAAPNQANPTDAGTLQASPIHLSPIHLSPIHLSPIHLSPIHLSPIRLSPIHLSPIHLSPIRLSTIFGSVDERILYQVNLAGISSVKPWEELIASYPDQPDVTDREAAKAAAQELLAMAPQDLTLGHLLVDLDPPMDTRLDQVDLSAVMDLSYLGTVLSTQPIGSVPAPGGADVCGWIATTSHLDCARDGIDPATETFAALDLRGFPMDQLDLTGVAVADIDLRSDTVLAGLPLADSIAKPVDLPDTTARIFRVSQTVLGPRAVTEVLANPATLLVCDGSISPNPCEGTMAGAEASFAFVDNTTVADLVAALTPEAAAAFDVPSALFGTAGLLDLPWSRFDTDPLDVDELTNGQCPGFTYTVSADVLTDAPVVDPTLSVVLPRGFDAKAGTASGLVDGVEVQVADGIETGLPDGRTRVDLTVPGIATSTVAATVQACASTTLGLFTAESSASWQTFVSDDGAPVLDTLSAPDEDPTDGDHRADVVVREREEPDDATSAREIAPETLIWRQMPGGTDQKDIYRIPIGEELPNGVTLQPGDRLRIWLAPPAGADADGEVTDLDLTVYAAQQSPLTDSLIEPTPLNDADPGIRPIEDDGAQIDGANGSAPPQSVQDSPIHLSPIRLSPIHLSPIRLSSPRIQSNNRGDRLEYAEIDIRPSDAGEISVVVSPKLGSASNRHYTLYYEVARPAGLDALKDCPAPADFKASTVTGGMPAVPQGTETLVLVNETVTASTYGAAATTQMMAALKDLAEHDRVNGVVLPVERDPDVARFVEQWRTTGWCDPVAANRVVGAIRSLVVDATTTVPSIANVVIVGADDVNPMARVPDMTALGREDLYVGDVLAATQQNNPLVAAYAAATTLTDDPYGTNRLIAWRDEALYVPELAIGRLLETPADVIVAAEQFVLANGLLDAADAEISALAAGYDFNADGAAAAAAGLQALGAGVDDDFVNGDWSLDDLLTRLEQVQPDLSTINAHANHHALLTARGDEAGPQGEVLTTRSLESGGEPIGRVTFTIACHFGTSVPDTYASDEPPVLDVQGETLDWAQLIAQRAGILVANTGFGYGTDEAVSFSERLMADFAEQMARTPTIGAALSAAKADYIASISAPSSLDRKTIQGAAMHGLPMYRFHDVPPVVDDPVTPDLRVDPVTGLTVVRVDTGSLAIGGEGTCQDCLQRIETEGGAYVDLVGPNLDGDPLVVQGRAIVPQFTQRYDLPGVEIGGFVPSAITSTDLPGADGGSESFDPVVARAVLSDGDLERPSEALDQAGPGTVGRTTVVGDEVVLTVPLGAFRGATIGRRGHVLGQYRVDTHLVGDLYVRDTTGGDVDRLAPEITDVVLGRPTSQPDLLTVRLDAIDDTGIARGVVALRSGGDWHFVELTVPAGAPTQAALLGSLDLPERAAVDSMKYWVVDTRGNVGSGFDKSLRPDVRSIEPTPPTSGVDPVVQVDGEQNNGWYVGDVLVTIVTGQSGTYHVVVDGEIVASLGVGESFELSGTGTHHVVVVADDDASKVTELTIMIDDSAPVGVFHVPNGAADDSERTWVVGDEVPIDLRCHDAISGVATCSSGDADGMLDTDRVGMFTLTATITDVAGNPGTASVTYHVVSTYRIEGFLAPVMDNRVDAEAGSTVPFKFRVFEGDTELTDVRIVEEATWQQVTCDGATTLGSAFVARAQPRLRYASDSFTFQAVTEDDWLIADCYRFRVTLVDGLWLDAIVTVT